MNNKADRGGCYPQRPKAEVDKTLRDLPKPKSLIALLFSLNNC